VRTSKPNRSQLSMTALLYASQAQSRAKGIAINTLLLGIDFSFHLPKLSIIDI
jgi:hypothetical protein